MTDPISDMLTRIRNTIRLKRASVDVPYSKSKFSIAKILEREGWVSTVERVEDRMPVLRITLRYLDDGSPTIRELRRVSKPGRRVYVRTDHLPVVLSNVGIAVVSTPAGMMTNHEAKKRGLGGEVICEVY